MGVVRRALVRSAARHLLRRRRRHAGRAFPNPPLQPLDGRYHSPVGGHTRTRDWRRHGQPLTPPGPAPPTLYRQRDRPRTPGPAPRAFPTPPERETAALRPARAGGLRPARAELETH